VDLSARTNGGAVMLLRSPFTVAIDYVRRELGYWFRWANAVAIICLTRGTVTVVLD
jgi:hypothetical protein